MSATVTVPSISVSTLAEKIFYNSMESTAWSWFVSALHATGFLRAICDLGRRCQTSGDYR